VAAFDREIGLSVIRCKKRLDLHDWEGRLNE
jgi:hypothetical protein